MRICKIYINSTGRKESVEDNTLTQNSSDSWIYLYTEDFYTNVNITFRLPNGKLSADYHMIYDNFDESENKYLYKFNIPVSILSFTMPTPAMKLEVGFKLWKNDESVYLMGTTVANTQITVNRSNNSDVLDASYNGTDVNNIWDKLGELTNKLNTFEVGNNSYYVSQTKFEELSASTPTEITKKDDKLYLSHNGTILDGNKQVGITMEPRYITIDPITAVHGTLTVDELSLLRNSNRNGIIRNHEIYVLTDDQFENNYITYAHASMVQEHKTGVIKSIRINLETRFWEFMEFEYEPKLPTPETDGNYILTCNVLNGIKTYSWEVKE